MTFIVIGGATASGKSGLAVSVAGKLKGEIISADSMQIYRHMDIGTAKITADEACGIKHHMIDIVEPDENFSVAQYSEQANAIIDELAAKKVPCVVCGGTGLYINALIYEYGMSSYDPALRQELMAELDEYGIDYMYEKLLKNDPKAVAIHKNNRKRVIRALEVLLSEGRSILDKDDKKTIRPSLTYAIDVEREILYNKINKRVDLMFAQGLTGEVDELINKYRLDFSMQSMQAIGYKEFADYYHNEKDLDEVKELIKQHTRNYAKRQNTWFKRIDSCKWIQNDDIDRISDNICEEYYKKIDNIE